MDAKRSSLDRFDSPSGLASGLDRIRSRGGADIGHQGSLAASGDEIERYTAVIIHKSQLYCDCLSRSIGEVTGARAIAYPRVDAWLDQRAEHDASLVLVCLAGLTPEDESQQLDLLLAPSDDAPPVVVMGDSEAPDYIINMLTRGARGYIPTSLSLDLTVKALHLVMAGGVFVPASSLLASQRSRDPHSAAGHSDLGMFTARQVAVINAIRRGKPNKTIAYELNMCESTVKVHVRNIMKKLQAKNRTEVAFIANQMLKERGLMAEEPQAL